MAKTAVGTPDPEDEPVDGDPTKEIGNASLGIDPWSAFYDTTEEVPELAFPNSPRVYDRMRNDKQIASLLLSFVLPIMGYDWFINPNGHAMRRSST